MLNRNLSLRNVQLVLKMSYQKRWFKNKWKARFGFVLLSGNVGSLDLSISKIRRESTTKVHSPQKKKSHFARKGLVQILAGSIFRLPSQCTPVNASKEIVFFARKILTVMSASWDLSELRELTLSKQMKLHCTNCTRARVQFVQLQKAEHPVAVQKNVTPIKP